MTVRHLAAAFLLTAAAAPGVAASNAAPPRLKVGIVQMAQAPTVAGNRDRIAAGIAEASARGARVVVFPESALTGRGNNEPAVVAAAVAAIRRATREKQVYVMFGATTYAPEQKRDTNWMLVIGPDGRDVFRYDKIYDQRRAPMPGVFEIDGIPCNAVICADRWLRGVEEIPIQQGAQVSFELSCNFASEWVDPLQWYWYVPRALRNNVWVVFANTCTTASASTGAPAATNRIGHGHSAIIAPDGRIVAASENTVTMVMADLDIGQVTRAEARARAAHPALREFWEAGLKLQRGQAVDAPAVVAAGTAPTDITLAVAQVTGDLAAMEAMIREARAKRADIVVFPARAIAGAALEPLQAAARENGITVVFGAEYPGSAGVPPASDSGGPDARALRNSAFVVGPDGSVLTRYDQLSAAAPFQPGVDPTAMWFHVKGVAAVVTLERDALWTELSELAAVAGAQLHVHLDHDPAGDPAANLRRRQVWSNLASFQTFTATANVVGSAIWDDLGNLEERRAEVRNLPRPVSGPVEVYSPFSANLVVLAAPGSELIVATRRVHAVNRHYPRQSSQINPQMDAWYRLGARLVRPQRNSKP